MSKTRKPLDPDEGPTLWVEVDNSNNHTYKLLVGTDPDDPKDELVISSGEAKRLKRFIDNNE